MWWILGILIWLAMGAFTIALFAIDWELKFGDGDHFRQLWGFYIITAIMPPVFLLIFFLDVNNKGFDPLAVIGKFIGKWFKDNINWKW